MVSMNPADRHLHPVPATGHGPGPVTDPARDGDRRRIQLGSDPDAIRVLTAELDGRALPGTYVTAGAPVVVESVSGATSPAAGDEDVPLPLAATRLNPARFAALLAEHVDLWRAATNAKVQCSVF